MDDDTASEDEDDTANEGAAFENITFGSYWEQ